MSAQRKISDHRRRLIAQVHLGKRDLALSEEDYRAILVRIGKRQSCADLGDGALARVLQEFERLGWRQDGGKRKESRRPRATDPQAQKIRAMWLSLYHLTEVRDPSEEALAAYAERMCGVAALQWLTPRHADEVIKGLRGWMKRVGCIEPDAHLKAVADTMRLQAGKQPATGAAERWQVLSAQWRMLSAGRHCDGTLFDLVDRRHGVLHPAALEAHEADALIAEFGRILREGGQVV
jgi:phage gp16-like protein